MGARDREGTDHDKFRQDAAARRRVVSSAVNVAISCGFVIGREVLVGSIPGVVVGYNLADFGRFAGNPYPLVVRTALGVTQCEMNEVSLV